MLSPEKIELYRKLYHNKYTAKNKKRREIERLKKILNNSYKSFSLPLLTT